MLTFIIPPAKEMDLPFDKVGISFPQVSRPIVDKLTTLSIDQLASFYGIKTSAAEREYDRWQAIARDQASAYPALQLYNGLMYRHMNRSDLSTLSTDLSTSPVGKSLYIATALYGIIPSDYPIVPHRLDFQGKLALDEGQSLKSYWRPHYDAWAQDQEIVVSLLSSEFEQVFSPKVQENLVRLEFLENRGGSLKKHATISKKARGAFVSQALLSGASTIQDLQTVQADNFIYQADLSTDRLLVYVKSVD